MRGLIVSSLTEGATDRFESKDVNLSLMCDTWKRNSSNLDPNRRLAAPIGKNITQIG